MAGIVRFSTLDYPGKLAAVLFTQGCPWKCAYCHNAHLQPLQGGAMIPPAALRHFFENRRGLLDAIVLSGGEPTLHSRLPDFAETILKFGFALGLHTNGMNPAGLQSLLPLCHWIGMDVKAPRTRYAAITGVAAFENVEKSARLLIESGIDYELRLTYHPALLAEDEVLETARHFSHIGAKSFILQVFRPQGCSAENLILKNPFKIGDLSRALTEKLAGLFPYFAIRNG
ncbi:MAG: anaerobic ribonucleoside-triphosphate reductase activating protein [Omnitrophica bacterium GWA2_52_8]|nr:MAG: anaerobic ribonucleoside-triphosphate reductase activating protein [Omnitrophica bacterium GWA2_52_8]